jgi:hypothetical protein
MSWTPPAEWEPELGERVMDSTGRKGVVIKCDIYGHFTDQYWRAAVRWDNGGTEYDIETSNLTREDGSQDRPTS